MLKKIRENLEGLDETISKLYKQQADGKFHLQLEDDDAEPLRRAKEHEVGLRQIAERDLATRTTELETANTTIKQLQADAGKDKNVLREQLETEYKTKEDKLVKAHEKEKGVLEETVKTVFVDNVAQRIAADLSDIPDLLIPLIKNRLKMEIVDGKPVTRVMTEDGKESSMSPDDLAAEYRQNKKFERIIRASKSSGGGASGGSGGGGASKKLADMGDAERREWAERDPVGFAAAAEAEKNKTAKV